MAHNLNYNEKNQEYAFFSRKEIPWHGLGQVVEKALTSEEAIQEAHLNYQVKLFPLQANIPGIDPIEVTEKFATVRTDTNQVLGLVGNRYEVVQNTQAFDFIDHIVGSKEAVFETAGALGNGEKIFVTAKLPTNIRIANTDDIIEEYLIFMNAHDASGSVQAGLTGIRVVCNNTLNMALKGLRNKVTFRHTSSVHDRIKQGLELLKLQRVYSLEFKETLNLLAKKKITDEKVDKLVQNLLMTPEELKAVAQDGINTEEVSTRKRNLYEEMRGYVESGVGQDIHQGTALWAFNGVSSYYSNGKKYKNDEDRFRNVVDGGWSQLQTQKAFNLLLTDA